MKLPSPRHLIPEWQNALLALVAAGLLILAFPDFEYWFLAWVALVPLIWAVERQKDSVAACFTLGWMFGTVFFFGTCWWLTYAPIHYAAMPWPLAYFLIFIVCLLSGLFPALFTTLLSILIRRFGTRAFLAAPFVWVFTEFLRYWLTGNNWNAIGYSVAFEEYRLISMLWTASIGGVLLTSGVIVIANSMIARTFSILKTNGIIASKLKRLSIEWTGVCVAVILLFAMYIFVNSNSSNGETVWYPVIAVQPNVPMSGVDYTTLERLRQRQIDLAQTELQKLPPADRQLPTTVILPESPMNFMYHDDREFQQFIGDFARRNNVSVLFNSAEPDSSTGRYFNSAVMVGPDGKEKAQYDKIYLLPFGEAVPPPLDGIVPGFVGNFSYGREYDLLPLGEAKAGVMICFESHFGQLSREYVRNGADVIIEMTNDGYLGPTPVLRQHLANSIFRAVETGRPVLRVTNVGITAHIAPSGDICDSLIRCGPMPYTEGADKWSVSKSDGSQTFYVKYGDWFAWLCSIVTILLLIFSLRKRSSVASA